VLVICKAVPTFWALEMLKLVKETSRDYRGVSHVP